MLQYTSIEVSERLDLNKPNASKECVICHY